MSKFIAPQLETVPEPALKRSCEMPTALLSDQVKRLSVSSIVVPVLPKAKERAGAA